MDRWQYIHALNQVILPFVRNNFDGESYLFMEDGARIHLRVFVRGKMSTWVVKICYLFVCGLRTRRIEIRSSTCGPSWRNTSLSGNHELFHLWKSVSLMHGMTFLYLTLTTCMKVKVIAIIWFLRKMALTLVIEIEMDLWFSNSFLAVKDSLLILSCSLFLGLIEFNFINLIRRFSFYRDRRQTFAQMFEVWTDEANGFEWGLEFNLSNLIGLKSINRIWLQVLPS